MEPYDTNLSARRWATLLDLEDPSGKGARRISDAIERLEDKKLIRVERSHGEVPRIFLLREDASGREYTTPSGLRSRKEKADDSLGDLYLQVPDDLWKGHIQDMSAPELVMLLLLLAEPPREGSGTWWSGTTFYRWYQITPGMRTMGTTGLIERRLLSVTKMMIDTPRGGNSDNRDRVRNSYSLKGPAQAERGARASAKKR